MEIDQVYKAPSIPKLNRRNIKSTLIGGAIKPGVELKKSKFSFIKPLVKLIPDSLVPIRAEENKESLVKNIQSGVGIQKLLEQSNKILTQIKEQLSLDFLSRINQEKKELAENKKKIAAEKVKDKEKKIESGGRGLLGKTLSTVVAPAKSIFQKLLDFFSIILTGILVNTAFKWLQKPENQKKLQDFFNFLKEYWQELLIVFGAVKLLGLVRKIWKIASAIKGLIDFFKKKPQLPCNCPKSPAQKGGLPDCEPVKDCVDNLVKDPRKGPGFLQSLAEALLTTKAFAPFLLLIRKPPQTAKPQQSQQPTQQPVQKPGQPAQQPVPQPVQQPGKKPGKNVPWYNTPLAQGLGYGALGLGLAALTAAAVVSPFEGPAGDVVVGSSTLSAFARAGNAFKNLFRIGKTAVPEAAKQGTTQATRQATTQAAKQAARQGTAQAAEQGTGEAAKNVTLNVTRQGAKSSVINNLFRSRVKTSVQQIFKNKNQKFDFNDRNTLDNLLDVAKKDPQDLTQYFRPNVDSKTRNIALEIWKKLGRKVPEEVQGRVTAGLFSKGGTISLRNLNQYVVSREKGGSIPYIPGLAGGGTVGGPGRLGVDSVPAMIASGVKTMMGGANALLAPGEEVIRTSSAMLFRPLLKDINDNAGRLWQAFTNAVRKQNLNETIVTDLIDQFGKIIQEFKDLLDKESSQLRQRSRANPGTGGTLNPRRIVPPTPAKSKSLSPSSSSLETKPQKMPSENMNMMKINLPSPPQQKITPSQVSTVEPKITLQNPVDITQNIIQPQLKVPSAEKTLVDNTKIYVIPLKETVPSFKTSSKSPTINHITLPTKTVNLGGSPKPKSLPSSPSGTSVPSISPIDESNDYVFTTPTMYGILV